MVHAGRQSQLGLSLDIISDSRTASEEFIITQIVEPFPLRSPAPSSLYERNEIVNLMLDCGLLVQKIMPIPPENVFVGRMKMGRLEETFPRHCRQRPLPFVILERYAGVYIY